MAKTFIEWFRDIELNGRLNNQGTLELPLESDDLYGCVASRVPAIRFADAPGSIRLFVQGCVAVSVSEGSVYTTGSIPFQTPSVKKFIMRYTPIRIIGRRNAWVIKTVDSAPGGVTTLTPYERGLRFSLTGSLMPPLRTFRGREIPPDVSIPKLLTTTEGQKRLSMLISGGDMESVGQAKAAQFDGCRAIADDYRSLTSASDDQLFRTLATGNEFERTHRHE